MRIRFALCIAASSFIVSSATADGMAVSGLVSLKGGGLQLTKQFSQQINVRIAYYQYKYQGPDTLATFRQLGSMLTDFLGITKSDNAYDHNANQQFLAFKVDWYPSEDAQGYLSLGLGYNKINDSIRGLELPLGGYTIGANHYSASQVGMLHGALKYNSFAPYIGYGWGNPVAKNKEWGMLLDVGLIYQGRPQVELNATGSVLQSDLTAERAKIVNDSWPWSPMLSVGVSYQW